MTRKLRIALRKAFNPFLVIAAFFWRRLLFRTTFIAITGSVGKTTAKECLYAVLSDQAPTVKTRGNLGARFELPRTILRTRPRHRYVVAEVGIAEPGVMWRSAWLLRPDIAVVLGVERTHSIAFLDLETTAKEKSKILDRLPAGGVAVLNGDDPRTAAMGKGRRGRTVLFGRSERLDLWSSGETSLWPERLRFDAHEGDQTQRIETQLVGTHWTPAVLGALAAARVRGVSLAAAAESIRRVSPFPLRMQPAALPSGATVLRDEFNGSIVSLEPALKVLREARVERRILVISDVADVGTNYRHRLRAIAQRAVGSVDLCVFVGEKSAYGRRRAIEAGMAPEATLSFPFIGQAADFLRRETRPGDLILLRGRLTDHLSRVYLGVFGQVECRKTDCRRLIVCDACPELGAELRAFSVEWRKQIFDSERRVAAQ